MTHEDEDEYKKRIFHQKVMESMNKGRLFYHHHDYDQAIVEFKTSLKLRDSFIGRYDEFTPSIYFFLGNCYYQKQDYDNAIVAYRTRIRIRRWLTGDNTFPSIDKRFLFCLERKGFNPQQIKAYNMNLNKSIRCEKRGDAYRSRGIHSMAIKKYRQAIAIEKNSHVGIQVTVAFLWRKIAFLLDKKGDTSCTDNDKHFHRNKSSSDCTICIENNKCNLNRLLKKDQEDQEIKPVNHEISPTSNEARKDEQIEEKRKQKAERVKDGKSRHLNDEYLVEKRKPLVSGEDETNVFQAIKNLADNSNKKVDWKLVVSCVDVKVNLREADRRTLRRSMPEIRQLRQASGSNNKPQRRSCTDFYRVKQCGIQEKRRKLIEKVFAMREG